MVRYARSCAIWSLLCGIVFVHGCSSGNPRYKVSGMINYKDSPIKDGLVMFIPEGGQAPAGGSPITNGKYEIPAASGLPPGKYRVSVSVPSVKINPKELETPGISVEPKETIPAKYNQNTELKAEVTAAGPNEFKFDLK